MPDKNPQEPRMQWPDLTQVLAGLRWAVTGAVATRLYMGSTCRNAPPMILMSSSSLATPAQSRTGWTPPATSGSGASPSGVQPG